MLTVLLDNIATRNLGDSCATREDKSMKKYNRHENGKRGILCAIRLSRAVDYFSFVGEDPRFARVSASLFRGEKGARLIALRPISKKDERQVSGLLGMAIREFKDSICFKM